MVNRSQFDDSIKLLKKKLTTADVEDFRAQLNKVAGAFREDMPSLEEEERTYRMEQLRKIEDKCKKQEKALREVVGKNERLFQANQMYAKY